MIEPSFPEATLKALADMGHELEIADPWSVGRMCAVDLAPDGVRHAAATPRLMQASAVGR